MSSYFCFTDRGLYLLNFMNISTARTVAVRQVIDIESIADTAVSIYRKRYYIYIYLDQSYGHRTGICYGT